MGSIRFRGDVTRRFPFLLVHDSTEKWKPLLFAYHLKLTEITSDVIASAGFICQWTDYLFSCVSKCFHVFCFVCVLALSVLVALNYKYHSTDFQARSLCISFSFVPPRFWSPFWYQLFLVRTYLAWIWLFFRSLLPQM